MGFNERCLNRLSDYGMFHDSLHYTRMKELLDCFSNKPFFNKGICKCMYLSAWDDEHFMIILSILNTMSLGKHEDTADMEVEGDSYVEESSEEESPVYQLSSSFLTGLPYNGPALETLPEETRSLMELGMKAAELIDDL